MRVATWNINSVTKRLDLLLDWLARTRPDVVALQELKAATAAFPTAALEAAGYHAVVVGQRAWNGVAILARGQPPLPFVTALPGDARDKEARYVEAAVHGVLFACLYLPNGNPWPGPKFDYKLQWFERLQQRAAELHAAGNPVVLLGDWNVVPTDADIYKPDTWRDNALLQPETRSAYAAIVAQGWTDAIAHMHPRGVPYTFWDYRRKRWERDAGLRIDHILVHPSITVASAGVDREERGREGASDHAPVWAELEPARPVRTARRRATAREPGPAAPSRARTPRLAPADMPPPGGGPLPAALEPQLATLVSAVPAGDWIVETKFDGYRLLARIEGGAVRLFTRNGHDWTDRLGPVAEGIAGLGLTRGWLDGEIVVLDDAGVPDFGRLQNAIDTPQAKNIVMFVFDLPFLGDTDLRAQPLRSRRTLLEALFDTRPGTAVRLSQSFAARPEQLLGAACRMGLEGVMAKRADAPYVAGRTDTWLKLKCQHRQEFVVVGFTDRSGAHKDIGSLLLGYHEGGALRYAGMVGTGWDARGGGELFALLSALEVETPSVDPRETRPGRWSKRAAGTERWVRPTTVVEVAFTEWTADGHVRHGVFRGIRTDKPATEIVRERAKDPAEAVPAARPKSARSTRLAVTHPERVVDPSTGLRKGDLVRYYERVADRMLPHLKGRPVSLVRAPAGITGELFFQKHLEGKMPGAKEWDAALWPGHAALLGVDAVAGLVGAAQMNVVEFHTWNSEARRIDKPDRFVLDLDPGEGVTWPMLQEAAATGWARSSSTTCATATGRPPPALSRPARGPAWACRCRWRGSSCPISPAARSGRSRRRANTSATRRTTRGPGIGRSGRAWGRPPSGSGEGRRQPQAEGAYMAGGIRGPSYGHLFRSNPCAR